MRVCLFVCCNSVCKSGLSSTKTKFEWHTPTRHKGIQCGLFSINCLLLCNLRYKCPNWTDSERLTERVYLYLIVELNLKLRSLFHYKQIVWENSDIKCMKVPSFSLTVTKHLTFELSRYFLWTIKINCIRFLGRLSTNVMTLIQIHSETNIFLSTKVIWEREKREDS